MCTYIITPIVIHQNKSQTSWQQKSTPEVVYTSCYKLVLLTYRPSRLKLHTVPCMLDINTCTGQSLTSQSGKYYTYRESFTSQAMWSRGSILASAWILKLAGWSWRAGQYMGSAETIGRDWIKRPDLQMWLLTHTAIQRLTSAPGLQNSHASLQPDLGEVCKVRPSLYLSGNTSTGETDKHSTIEPQLQNHVWTFRPRNTASPAELVTVLRWHMMIRLQCELPFSQSTP
jgi:hypothetical protein